MKRQPPRNQPLIVVMKSPGDTASRARAGRSPQDRRQGQPPRSTSTCPRSMASTSAVATSEGGSEDGRRHVIDVATGKELADEVPRVQYPTGGGSIAWDAKGTGFYYTRYPQGKERAAGGREFLPAGVLPQAGHARRAPTPTRSARNSRASPRRRSNRRATAATCSRPSPTATAASSPTTCTGREGLDEGRRSRGPGAARQVRPRRQPLCCCRSRTRRAARCSRCRWRSRRSPRAKTRRARGRRQRSSDIDAARRRACYVTYMVGGPSELRVFDLAGKALGARAHRAGLERGRGRASSTATTCWSQSRAT